MAGWISSVDIEGRDTPAQDKIRKQINDESRNLARLFTLKNSDLVTEQEKSQLVNTTMTVKKLESQLKRMLTWKHLVKFSLEKEEANEGIKSAAPGYGYWNSQKVGDPKPALLVDLDLKKSIKLYYKPS